MHGRILILDLGSMLDLALDFKTVFQLLFRRVKLPQSNFKQCCWIVEHFILAEDSKLLLQLSRKPLPLKLCAMTFLGPLNSDLDVLLLVCTVLKHEDSPFLINRDNAVVFVATATILLLSDHLADHLFLLLLDQLARFPYIATDTVFQLHQQLLLLFIFRFDQGHN